MRDVKETRVRRLGTSLETENYPRTTLFAAHHGTGDGSEVRAALAQAAARWNAVLDALAEYEKSDSTGQMLPRAADRMAEILRNALNA